MADVATAVRHLRFVLDPDGVSQAQLDAYDDQQLTFRNVGTMVAVTGYLSAETAAKVRTALEATLEGWYRTGSLPAADTTPAGSADAEARRRRYRRPHLLALALADLAERALDAGALGTRHRVRPHVTLTLDLERLLAGWGGQLAVPGDDPVALPSQTHPPDHLRRRRPPRHHHRPQRRPARRRRDRWAAPSRHRRRASTQRRRGRRR